HGRLTQHAPGRGHGKPAEGLPTLHGRPLATSCCCNTASIQRPRNATMRCHSIEFSGMIGATFRAKRSASSFKLATARSRIVAKLGLPSPTPRAMAASTRVQRSNGALFDHFVGVVQA